jgi:hypothetical protein
MLSEKQIASAERRYYNCLAIHKASKKGTWAYEFWLKTANAVKRNSDRKRPFVNTGYFLNE